MGTFGAQTTAAAVLFCRYQQREQKRDPGNGHEHAAAEARDRRGQEKVTIMLELYKKTNISLAKWALVTSQLILINGVVEGIEG